jgi:hypothetical protein
VVDPKSPSQSQSMSGYVYVCSDGGGGL